MRVTIRTLPPEEWDRLKGILEVSTFIPEITRVLVVEGEDGELVGATAIMPAVLVKGTWFKDKAGNTEVENQLYLELLAVTEEATEPVVLTGVDGGRLEQFVIETLRAHPVDGQTYEISVADHVPF